MQLDSFFHFKDLFLIVRTFILCLHNFIRKHFWDSFFTMPSCPKYLCCVSFSNCGQVWCEIILHNNNDIQFSSLSFCIFIMGLVHVHLSLISLILCYFLITYFPGEHQTNYLLNHLCDSARSVLIWSSGDCL